jgi:hypothetical protein
VHQLLKSKKVPKNKGLPEWQPYSGCLCGTDQPNEALASIFLRIVGKAYASHLQTFLAIAMPSGRISERQICAFPLEFYSF